MMESMETPRRRTPLSDQTNTTTTTPSFAPAATTSVTTTTTQSKPLKPYTATTRTRLTTTCSPKSNSSIGSNLPETVLESGGRRSVARGTSEETPVAKTRKVKQNVIPKDTSIERFSSDSGTNVCEKVGFQTTCNPRRGIEKVINAHRSTAALSCSHGKRSRKTWFKVDTGAIDCKSGSFFDPLPLHKKMRRRRHAKPVPSMPPDETEKLRVQYAEIDAFELPVESESE